MPPKSYRLRRRGRELQSTLSGQSLPTICGCSGLWQPFPSDAFGQGIRGRVTTNVNSFTEERLSYHRLRLGQLLIGHQLCLPLEESTFLSLVQEQEMTLTPSKCSTLDLPSISFGARDWINPTDLTLLIQLTQKQFDLRPSPPSSKAEDWVNTSVPTIPTLRP